MVKLRPFQGYLANKHLASKIIAPPYDVLNSQEARVMAHGNEYSFLHVNKPEIDLDEMIDPYNDQVYLTGRSNLLKFISNGWLERDSDSRFYVYSQSFPNSQAQFGLVSASSIEDYETNKIKRHEKTLAKKEEDRTKLTNIQSANVGPVFLTYQKGDAIREKVAHISKTVEPYQTVLADDLVTHTVRLLMGISYSCIYSCGKSIQRRISSSQKSSRTLRIPMWLMAIIELQQPSMLES